MPGIPRVYPAEGAQPLTLVVGRGPSVRLRRNTRIGVLSFGPATTDGAENLVGGGSQVYGSPYVIGEAKKQPRRRNEDLRIQERFQGGPEDGDTAVGQFALHTSSSETRGRLGT